MTDEYHWSWRNQDTVLGLDDIGNGAVVLLLPALSSISTHEEMRPLAERLALQFRVVFVDWPGFGTRPRPGIRWTPEALSNFLDDLLLKLLPRPHAIVAAGHAATYVLHHIANHPGVVDRIVLLAPTWRGPLPTMAGGDRPFFKWIRRTVELSGIGPVLYRLNVNPLVVRKMAVGHVYSDAAWLTADRIKEKRRVIDAAGARFGSVAFVTGGLDRVQSRAEFLGLAERSTVPILLVYGAETPPRSRAEMEALCRMFALSVSRAESCRCTKSFPRRSPQSCNGSFQNEVRSRHELMYARARSSATYLRRLVRDWQSCRS